MSMRQRMIRRRLLAALAFAAAVVPSAAQARPDFYVVPTTTPTQAVAPPSAPARQAGPFRITGRIPME